MIKRKIPGYVMAGNSTQFAQVIPYSGQISFGYRYKSKRQVRKWCNRKLRRSVYASMMGNGPKWWHVSAPICRVCHKEHKGNYSTVVLPGLGWKAAAPVACPTIRGTWKRISNLAKFILTQVFIVILFLTYVIFSA